MVWNGLFPSYNGITFTGKTERERFKRIKQINRIIEFVEIENRDNLSQLVVWLVKKRYIIKVNKKAA
ncbi:hypothetical protein CMETHOX_21750 [Lacrimispora indolis]|nr:hypothetical protein CMETHOX_21750 [[Clostridium] methoxybenzovorans]